jgi:hypothetical protein
LGFGPRRRVAGKLARDHIRSVVTISITADAFKAIEATLLEGYEADARPDGKGGYLVTLPHGVLDRLKAIRGPL